jgi:[acyl-carrier-protein] S-malonyltransferase
VTRALVAFPGRGSYGPGSLGSLDPEHAWVREADRLRAADGLPSLTDLDASSRFDPALHGRPTNAWPLTFLIGLLDAERIAGDHDVVVVVASSTGWYTALAAAGALEFDEAFRLVGQMAAAAEEEVAGGAAELVYPLVDEAWVSVPDRGAAVDAALDAIGDGAGRALELGPFTVVGGSATGVRRVGSRLPTVTVSGRDYPITLGTRDAWHTPLRAAAVERAAERLGALAWRRPSVTLVDGRGRRHTPWSADVRTLAEESVATGPTERYDFATSFRVALREYAPDIILLPGPGATLGTACAQLVVAEGYRGIRSRTELEELQGGTRPILLAVRR